MAAKRRCGGILHKEVHTKTGLKRSAFRFLSLRSFSYTRCMAVRFPCTARSSTDDMGRILLSGRPVPAVPVRSAIQYSTRG